MCCFFSAEEGTTGDIYLTARWTPVSYTITYEGVGDVTNSDPTSYTVEDYIMNAWYSDLEAVMDIDTAEDDMEILKTYILDNIMFDVGNLTNGWAGFLDSVKSDSYKNGTNNFEQAFREAEEQALISVGTWNENWSSYTE